MHTVELLLRGSPDKRKGHLQQVFHYIYIQSNLPIKTTVGTFQNGLNGERDKLTESI